MTVSLPSAFWYFLGGTITILGHAIRFQAANSMSVFLRPLDHQHGVFRGDPGGLGSNNKFSLLGGLRSHSADDLLRVIHGWPSWDCSWSIKTFGSGAIVERRKASDCFGPPLPLPKWGIFSQPVGFLLFFSWRPSLRPTQSFDLAEANPNSSPVSTWNIPA